VLRQGEGEPLVLFHGILGSEQVWRHVIPLLSADHDVIAPTALGHRGGPRPTSRPSNIRDVIDAGERQLDDLGIEKAHLAGNSMGGWMSLELARRGRALSVCALSPAGFWEEGWAELDRVLDFLRKTAKEVRRARRIIGPLSRSSRFRRWALREVCFHGERVSREDFLVGSDDTIGCYITEELTTPGYSLDGFEAPCPVTLAWSAEDRFFPLDVYRERAEGLIQGARLTVLDDVGHVPMLDDPKLVADAILAVTGGRQGQGIEHPGR
jgi:pimeloyl-ACP methyl ester carboxylesterase